MSTKPEKDNNKIPFSELLRDSIEKDEIRLSLSEDLANLGSWEWRSSSNKLWWSKKVYEIFGLNPESFTPTFEKFLSFVHHEDSQKVKNDIQCAIGNNEKYQTEHRIIRPDGTVRTLVEQAEVICDNNKPEGMIGIVRDITEEKAIKQRLAKQKKELKLHAKMLDLAHDKIFIHDLNGKILFWNKGAEKTYGWNKSEALGGNIHELLKTEFNVSLSFINSEVVENHSWNGELVHTTKNGSKIIVESRWVLHDGQKGQEPSVLEIARNITHKKSAENEIRQAQNFAESIIETIQESLLVLNSNLKVIKANKSFYELFSLDPQQTEYEYIYNLAKGRWDVTELKDLLENILPRNTSINEYEMNYLAPDQMNKTLLLNARRIYTKDHKTEMILLAMQDITPLKKREQQIRYLTEQLVMSEENQRQEIATVLHDSIAQTLAFSNRELKTISKKVDPEIAVSLSVVCKQISKTIRQTRQLTSNLSSPTLNTFGLEAGIEELAENFQQKHKFNCQMRCQEKVGPLPKKFEILFYNILRELLTNIAKHANASNVQIYLKTNGNELELVVIDDGDGFDTGILDQADFEKQSFGLFNIRQRLINLYGKIKFESEKNKGTKVIVNAPVYIEY